MRAILMGVGALLFLAYPLVLLVAIAWNLDETQQGPTTAAIVLTPRSASQWLERDAAQLTPGTLRSATIRNSGH